MVSKPGNDWALPCCPDCWPGVDWLDELALLEELDDDDCDGELELLAVGIPEEELGELEELLGIPDDELGELDELLCELGGGGDEDEEEELEELEELDELDEEEEELEEV